MTARAYTEDQLVEQPAITLFAEMGWKTVKADEETYGPIGTLQRDTKSEVVLVERLRNSLQKLNPTIPAEGVTKAIDDLIRDRSSMSLEAANREVYQLIKDGIIVSVPNEAQGGQKQERLRIIDWDNAEQNDFLLVSQFSITGNLYTCRPDLVGFVNGLPLVVIELKKPGVPARNAFDDNLTHYKQQIPSLFWYNALLIASNGTDSRVGSVTANWERFFEWKRIEQENEQRRVSLDVMIRGTCDRSRLLDLVENFTIFSKHKSGLTKIIGQNHQFLGVNNAIQAMLTARQKGDGRAGVFWQTQGSGKSYSMVFYAQKVLRKVLGDWNFVIVTDRVELDEQIATTFKACGALDSGGVNCHAGSGAELRELLQGNHRYVFTLIQKFGSPEVLCDRADVIVMTDEAHRSQYDTLAVNMRASLPNAQFVAFTGTPLIAGEERTKDVFGDYVSIYNFQQSVEDGATVPLFYENRTPELQLTNPDLNEEIYKLIDEADLDSDQEAKLERELGRQYHIITRDDRLDTVAKDVMNHFLGRGFQGKAMVISIDKATALKMYHKVEKLWAEETKRVEQVLAKNQQPAQIKADLLKRLEVLKTTDMAVIVSPGQNEIEQMQKHGLDILPHRQRMNAEELDEKFKDTQDNLRIVFVCAMWLTGFDAPSCSTIYLDKPMRNHTLMQTIARANRVFPGKHSGLIVDYANVFASLEKALAIYGEGTGGELPVKDKNQLIQDLKKSVEDAALFCTSHGVDLGIIEAAQMGSMDRLTLIDDAVNLLISPDPIRKEFLAKEMIVRTLYNAVKPSPSGLAYAPRVSCLAAIADSIKAKVNPGPIDISGVMGQINTLLDESIAGVEMASKPLPLLDLSKIDFAQLAGQFKESKKKNIELEALKASVKAMMDRLISINSTRVDFREKFEALIEEYNTGSKSIERLYQDLLDLSRSLSEEQTRHVRENLTEEELTIFDLLTQPDPTLTTEEKAEVKKVAKQLMGRMKTLITQNWRQTTQGRAKVSEAIKATLDSGLPDPYGKEIYDKKCGLLFEHIYEAFPDEKAIERMAVG